MWLRESVADALAWVKVVSQHGRGRNPSAQVDPSDHLCVLPALCCYLSPSLSN